MDIEYNLNLSHVSRHILYRFIKKLESENTNLNQIVYAIFKFDKVKFNRRQFQQIINKYDKNLVLNEIDNLFDQLDQSKNDCVFIETFQQALRMISEEDNPHMALNMKSKIMTQNSIPNIAIAFKDRLTQTENYIELISYFVVEEDGLLNKQNVNQILTNFEFNEKTQRFMNFVFKDANKISVKEFLQVLGLGDVGTRVNIENVPADEKKQIPQEQMSEQILNYQKSQIRDKKQSVRESIDPVFSSSFKIGQIPTTLQPYFNYGSSLSEPFATYASEFISTKTVFIDDQNPTSSKATMWAHLQEICPNYEIFGKFNKLAEVINPKAIKQGGFGDCYFLSAIAAIVQKYPQLVYRLFILEKNPSHIFGIKLFIDGVWRTIPLDACFPLNKNKYPYGAQPADSANRSHLIWVMLLEKAWAKVYLSYDNIHSGYNEEGLLAISGAPCFSFKSQQQGFLQRLFAYQTKGSIITCSTSKHVGQLTEAEQENLGIFSGHAYTILKVIPKFLHRNQETILLKIKNPWGRKGWKTGDWSPTSDLWTPELRQKYDHHPQTNDGTFFMSYADFAIYFDYVNISMVNLAYQNSSIHNKSDRFDFYENRFTIKENDKGNYFLTIYQQNGRKYGKMGVFQKSKSWMFLAKIEDLSEDLKITKLTTIACNAQAFKNNTIETTLQPGQYVIVSRVAWKYWNQYSYTLTSYGPNKIKFSEGKKAETALIYKIIESRAQQIGKINGDSTNVYREVQVRKNYLFDVHSGIGYIKLTSYEENMLFFSQLSLEPSIGIHAIPPNYMPLQIDLLPLQNKTFCFIVQPDGMRFHMRQQYKYTRAQ